MQKYRLFLSILATMCAACSGAAATDSVHAKAAATADVAAGDLLAQTDAASSKADVPGCGPTFAEQYDKTIVKAVADGEDGLIVAGNVIMPAGTTVGASWVAKLGAGGAKVWEQTYSGLQGITGDLARLPTGELAVLRGVPGGSGPNVLALAADGTELWTKGFVSADSSAQAWQLRARPNGVFTMVGRKSVDQVSQGWLLSFDLTGATVMDKTYPGILTWTSAATSSTGAFTVFGGPQGGVVAAGLADDGSIAWQKAIGTGGEFPFAASTQDGGYFVAYRGYYKEGKPDEYVSVIKVARLDAAGNTLWVTDHGAAGQTGFMISGIAATSDGGYVVTGSFSDSKLEDLANKGGKLGPNDILFYWYVLRGKGDGTALWASGYAPGGGNGGQTTGMALLCGDSLALVGLAAMGTPNYGSWVVRMDPGGNMPLGAVGTTLPILPP